FSVFPIIYIAMGVLMAIVPQTHTSTPGLDPRFMAYFFIILGATFTLGFGVFGSLQLYAARCLRLRQSRTFCLIIAGISCLMVPFGTALGIFSFIVLGRVTVQRLFQEAAASATLVAPEGPPSAT